MSTFGYQYKYNNKVLPIEVKSGKDYKRHSALSNILEISNYYIDQAFILNNYNVKRVGKCIYYPIYMIMFIEDDINLPAIELIDLSKDID